MLREFIGLEARAPLWFDEGVASANEEDSIFRYVNVAKANVENNMYMHISNLDKIQAKTLTMPSLFYSSAASIIIFLLDDYKKNKFPELCKAIKKKGFYVAMEEVYGFSGPGELEEEYIEDMKKIRYDDIRNGSERGVNW